MFAITSRGGMDFGIPDVCRLPTTIPVPFPNFAAKPMGTSPAYKVRIGPAPVHTLATTIPLTSGDNPGLLGGVISGRNMGPARRLRFSRNTLWQGKPAVVLSANGLGNQINTNSTTIVPSQTKVLILK
ncbi:DUF4150 domain-containing protein [Sorangium sp. So ce302]|uniref:DUF4150 domain-containing protein n=1 Tax=unclassified Sorangium TaxID=2621164 RepID=UPI003F62040E